MVSAVTYPAPSSFVVPAQAGTHNHQRPWRDDARPPSTLDSSEYGSPLSRGRRQSCGWTCKRANGYFIGQMASATAACGGKMVTNFLPTYCNSTGSASSFWPCGSNLTSFHGMMV